MGSNGYIGGWDPSVERVDSERHEVRECIDMGCVDMGYECVDMNVWT
jgi:hypothetical protein